MDQGPKFQGSLEKQGRLAKGWKKYWFILKDSQLTYVKSQDKMSSQGHIDMSQAQSIRSISGKSGGHLFEIVTRSRTHYLNADTTELRDKWVKVLHDAMAWYSRHSSSSSMGRLSHGGSTRASCNSIEEDDYGYSRVSFTPTGSPARSSGYSTSDTSNDHTSSNNTDRKELRDSGTSDIMYTNPDYGMKRVVNGQASSHRENDRIDSQPLYEDVRDQTPRHSQHQGLRRLHPLPGKGDTSDSRAESMLSDASGLYDSVHEPAQLAISHIVKGYANIARNKGPQSQVEDDDEEADYDDVFVDGERSSVVMRKSQRMSSSEQQASGNEPPYATVDVQQKKLNKALEAKRTSALPTDINTMFEFKAVKDLPNPRMELTHRTSFDDVRQFLANNRDRHEYYVAEKPNEISGKGVKALKEFLMTMDN